MTYSIVDLNTSEKFGNYPSLNQAKGKGLYYATEFRTYVAVIDTNNTVLCGYTPNGRELKSKENKNDK